jgi:two-component system chemotaxis response regulator CheY
MNSLSTRQPAGRSLRVLYAEDLGALRELMRLVLAPEGHTLETYADGNAACERLLRGPNDFDLIITDHHMPVMNGLDLVRAIRLMPFSGRIIVFSSELNPSIHDEYVRLKVDQVLAKPVRPAVLRALLADMFPAHQPA